MSDIKNEEAIVSLNETLLDELDILDEKSLGDVRGGITRQGFVGTDVLRLNGPIAVPVRTGPISDICIIHECGKNDPKGGKGLEGLFGKDSPLGGGILGGGGGLGPLSQ
jgi:hypothetical protein